MDKDKYVHKEGSGSLFKNNYKEKETQVKQKQAMTSYLSSRVFHIRKMKARLLL